MRKTLIKIGPQRLRIAPHLLLSALLCCSCRMDLIDDPLSIFNGRTVEGRHLFGNNGLEKNDFYRGETLFLSIDDLYESWQTDVQIIRLSDRNTLKRLVVITDEWGRLTRLPLWYFIGIDENGNPVNASGEYLVHIEQVNAEHSWNIFSLPFKVHDAPKPTPQVYTATASGVFAGNGIFSGEAVYAAGSGFASGIELRLYIVRDRADGAPGTLLEDRSGGFETVTTRPDGTIPVIEIWSAAVEGEYDIVADAEPFGEYDERDAVSDPVLCGLLVHARPGDTDILQDVACDNAGNHRDQFDPLEPVFARVLPGRRSSAPAELAAVYVTVHRKAWLPGMPLTAIETVGSMEMPVFCLVNPVTGALATIRIRGAAKPDYQAPLRLWPGEYDVIVDVDRNAVYDPGVDILDGGSGPGFVVDGPVPELRLIESADVDFLGVASASTAVWARLVRGDGSAVPGAAVWFRKGPGPGSLYPGIGITDSLGLARVLFSDMPFASITKIHVETQVDSVNYSRILSIIRKNPHRHNQGIVTGN